jgi:hypothetical protein
MASLARPEGRGRRASPFIALSAVTVLLGKHRSRCRWQGRSSRPIRGWRNKARVSRNCPPFRNRTAASSTTPVTRPASRATAHRSGIGQPRHRRLPFLIRRAVTFLFPFLFFWYSGNFPVSGVCRFAQLRSQIRAGLSFVFGHGQHGQLDTMCDPVGAAAHS